MSESVRRYRALRQALNTLYPTMPQGNVARHLETLAAMINGIVGSGQVHLTKIAAEHADGRQLQSRVKQYTRFVQNEQITLETYVLPYIEALLAGIGQPTFLLAIDTSVVGRGCLALMLSLIHKRRAIPLCWTVTAQKKGHLLAQTHTALVDQLQPLLPPETTVIVVGDGEFDSVEVLAHLQEKGWHYVCRSDKDALFLQDGAWHRFDQWQPAAPRMYSSHPHVYFTKGALYGPLHAVCYWDRVYPDPLYLVTDLTSAQQAAACYRKRAVIETFFSDQKSRGFHLHKSHMSDPQRLERLLMAACLAYIWIVYLGKLADSCGFRPLLDRGDRADVSLFQLGLRFLKYLTHLEKPIPVMFQLDLVVPPWLPNCVR